jgi:hypothetical protein
MHRKNTFLSVMRLTQSFKMYKDTAGHLQNSEGKIYNEMGMREKQRQLVGKMVKYMYFLRTRLAVCAQSLRTFWACLLVGTEIQNLPSFEKWTKLLTK